MSHAKIGRLSKKDLFKLPDGTHRLEPNLYLRVRAKGKYRNYVFRYQDEQGQCRDVAMGSASKKSFQEVKQNAYFFRTVLSIAGKNTNCDLNARRPLFKDYASEVIELLAKVRLWKNPAQKQSWISSINTYAVPVFGEKFVDEVTRNDVLKVLNPLWANKTMTASRLRGRMERIFSYAIHDGLYIGVNPAEWSGNLELFLPPPRKCASRSHFRCLSFEELRSLIPKLEKEASIGAKAVLFGVLTATRTVEFTQAHWREISWKEKIWNCPPSRRKDGKDETFRVPLSDQAIALLKRLRRDSTGEFIFSVDNKTAIRRETPRKYLRTTLNTDATMHGMRSTFRDWCAENDVDHTLAEQCLMHKTGNETFTAYQRSDLVEKRREIMQLWADALCSIENPSL